jgi:hypothetical protein
MRFLITGSTNGMGRGVAQALASANGGAHHVIIHGRSPERVHETVASLMEATGNDKISAGVCDFARLSETRRFAEELRASLPDLDGIFVNAGVGYAPRRLVTADGLDQHFQVNYLSQFILVQKLLPLLKKSAAGGRVVFNVFKGGEMFWDDLQMEKTWGYERGIKQAMAAKRLFYGRLHRELVEQAEQVSCFGFQIHKTVWSNQVNLIPGWMRSMASLMKFFGQFITIEECGAVMAPLFTEERALTMVRSGKLVTWKKGHFTSLPDDPGVLDTGQQDRLWETSCQLIGGC